MKILAISGSARRASTNTALLRALAMAAPEGLDIEVWAGVTDLPVFSQDEEGARTPEPVLRFAAQVAWADALVIACPEYVHALPGGFKNAIDWLVSREEIIGKPIALIHASLRNADVLADLRRVLSTVSEGFLPDVFDAFELRKQSPEEIAAEFTAPGPRQRLLDYLAALEHRIKTLPPPD